MAETHRPIGVGLIGYGFAGSTFHAPLIRATSGLELRAVVSSNSQSVHADLPGMVVHTQVHAMLADPAIELVVIATPNRTHAPLARAALTAGKHVVVDKPFAIDAGEARGVIRAASDADRLLCVFHNRRWDSDYLSIRAAIEDDAIGEVASLESRFERFRPEVRSRWRDVAGPGAGLWYDLGPHLIDQALQLFGLPDRVFASLAVQRAGAQVDDWAHVILSFGKRRVLIHAGLLAAGGAHRFVVHGARGSLVKHDADRQEIQLREGMRPGAPGWGEDPDPVIVYAGEAAPVERPAISGDQRRFYAKLANAMVDGSPPPVSVLEALAVMAVLDAARRSSEIGRWIEPELTEEEHRAWDPSPQ